MNKPSKSALMLFEMLSNLHKKGYERLRIMSYMSPTGLSLRCVISVKENFDKTTGFVCCEDERYPMYRYTTGSEFDYFGDGNSKTYTDADELAESFIKEYPALVKQGKGADAEYAAWYEKMMVKVRKNHFPIAFEDYGFSIFGADAIKMTGDEWMEFAPAGEYEEKQKYNK